MPYGRAVQCDLPQTHIPTQESLSPPPITITAPPTPAPAKPRDGD
ncbi:hypothetical protein TSAR_015129 [Trichomalopsis sarcophagae]|uniref:Uncharacterized protein n=1 Tax=Trichomalopsis sarcophagae TaxID=543379 RepID=A0A232ES32_9HYME|nr:hypothetical protein TSAR_015129 [Trichomalopsis sarcophagae]